MTYREQEARAITHSLREINGLVTSIQTKVLLEANLTPQQFSLLEAIGNAGAMTNAEASEALCLSKGTTSGILKRLVGQDLLLRNEAQTDRRQTFFKLSAKGEALFTRFDGWQEDITAALFDGVTNAELTAWSRQLSRLCALLRQQEEAVSSHE